MAGRERSIPGHRVSDHPPPPQACQHPSAWAQGPCLPPVSISRCTGPGHGTPFCCGGKKHEWSCLCRSCINSNARPAEESPVSQRRSSGKKAIW